MSTEHLKKYGLGLGFVFLQVTLFRHLKIYNIQPDVVIIFLLWYTMRQNRTAAILMAAVLGFMQDALLDLWGLHMFSKTLLVFSVYNFIPRNPNLRLITAQVFITVFTATLFHNLIFLVLNYTVENYSAEFLFWSQWLGNSFYTALIASFLHLFRTK